MAADSPHRLLSLTLINTHAGGFRSFPPVTSLGYQAGIFACLTLYILYII